MHDEFLGADVQADGGFVEQHDRGVDEQCAGDADALALPAGQPDPAGADGGVEPVGEMVGELADQRRVGGRGDLGVGGVGAAVAEVVGQGAGEQEGVLQHHGDLLVQPVLGGVGHRVSVEQDLAGGGAVEAADQGQEGRLAGAVVTEQGDPLAGVMVRSMSVKTGPRPVP